MENFTSNDSVPLSTSNPILVLVLYSLVSGLILVGNLLVITAIYRTPSLQTPSNIFVLNLAIVDFLVGVTCIMAMVNLLNPWMFNTYPTCTIRVMTAAVTIVVSGFFVAGISIDRVIAIQNPFRYEQQVTIRRSCGMTIAIWTYCIVIVAIPTTPKLTYWSPNLECKFTTTYNPIFAIAILSHVMLAILVVVVCSGILFRIASRHQKQIRASEVDPSGNVRSQKIFIHMKAAKTLLIVTGTFCVCCLPFMCHAVSKISFTLNGVSTDEEPKWLIDVFIALLMLNSGINPVIYARGLPTFRRAFKRIITFGTYGNSTTLQH